MKRPIQPCVATIALLWMLLGAAGAGTDQGVTGKWLSEFDSGVGHQKYTFDFKVDGEKLTGTAHRDVEGEVTDTPITDGKITNEDISFVEALSRDGQDIRIEYKGKVTGEEMHLTRAVADFATSDITVRRAKGSTTQPSTKPG